MEKFGNQKTSEQKIQGWRDKIISGEDYDGEPNPECNETLEEWLEGWKREVDRNPSHLTQYYIPTTEDNVEDTIELTTRVFSAEQSFVLSIPDNQTISSGVFELVKDFIEKQNIPKNFDGTVVVTIDNFTEKANNIVGVNSVQPFTHLYNQQTGEDMTSILRGEENKKTFGDNLYKVVIITLLTDKYGEENLKKLIGLAGCSEFSSTLPITLS